MIWVKYVFLCRSSFKNSQKRQKTISIPHWYRYGLSKNEQSKFETPPPRPPEIVKFANLSHQWKLGSKITCKHATNNSTIQISHLLTHDHNWGGSKKSSNSQILNSISINFSVKQKPTKNLLKALKFNWYLTFVNVSS